MTPSNDNKSAKEETKDSSYSASAVTISPFMVPDSVAVHPLVMLSVLDHYKRAVTAVGAPHTKRVVGALLGHWTGRTVSITNAFAVPFEEDPSNPLVWFLDHDYMEHMNDLFRKVAAKERLVGWYHTGPKLRNSDVIIHDAVRRLCLNPVVLVSRPLAGTEGHESELPLDAYIMRDELAATSASSTSSSSPQDTRTFQHVKSFVEAEEAEEVGVEHLLRDVKDAVTGTVSAQLATKIDSLRGLEVNLSEIIDYLEAVETARLPLNHRTLHHLQDLLLTANKLGPQERTELAEQCNDNSMLTYVGQLSRSILALHDLIKNKYSLLEETVF